MAHGVCGSSWSVIISLRVMSSTCYATVYRRGHHTIYTEISGAIYFWAWNPFYTKTQPNTCKSCRTLPDTSNSLGPCFRTSGICPLYTTSAAVLLFSGFVAISRCRNNVAHLSGDILSCRTTSPADLRDSSVRSSSMLNFILRSTLIQENFPPFMFYHSCPDSPIIILGPDTQQNITYITSSPVLSGIFSHDGLISSCLIVDPETGGVYTLCIRDRNNSQEPESETGVTKRGRIEK